MRTIEIKIPAEAFTYMLRNTTTREISKKKEPKYVLYYRHKTGALGQAVITLDTLFTIASQCDFPSYKLKREFLDEYIPSLKYGLIESNTNYVWRAYSWVY
jgi:hypothetical protein